MIENDILKQQLITPLSNLEFVAFDFETTGLYANIHKIIEIGAVKFSLQKSGSRFTTLINPLIPVPSEASLINGITDHMLQDKPVIQEVLPHFVNFVGNAVLVAHNASFDLSFLTSSLKTSNLQPLNNYFVDTIELAKQILPGRKKYSLDFLSRTLMLQTTSTHRAEADALACKDLFLYCVKRIHANGDVLLKDLYSS
jgi:DNA polymerase III epsilon subunit family exonuclease